MRRIAPGYYSEKAQIKANGKEVVADCELYKVDHDSSEIAWTFTIKGPDSERFYTGEDYFDSKKDALESLKNLLKIGFKWSKEDRFWYC
jgi:hypothetical protein